MYRVVAKDVTRRVGAIICRKSAVVGWNDGFGNVFACEAGTSGRVAWVKDQGRYLV